MLFVRMPKERVAVLIGHDGKVKKQIEKLASVKINVESKSGDVAISFKGNDTNFKALAARDIVKAIARGFSPNRAMCLFDDDNYLELLDVRDYAGKSHKHNRRIRARLIGTKGKTRHLIEELSGAEMSIYGNTVGLIGDVHSLDAAKRATQMLLEGSEHSAVYRFLEGRRREMKFMEMGMQ
ncbi:MAG: RNA-processing protein [Thermoplasmata archaeon]|nr:RNA-processing protein [Thermoplasmata archaeon]